MAAPALGGALLVLLAAPAGAQPRALDEVGERLAAQARQGVVLYHGGAAEIDLGAGRVALAGPGIELRIGHVLELLAEDGVVLWGRPRGTAVEDLQALYAEGAVWLRLYGDTFAAAAVYLDVQGGRGLLLDAELRAIPPEEGGARPWAAAGVAPLARGSLLLRARRAELGEGFRRLLAEQAEISTCTFAVPHYALAAARIELVRQPAEAGGEGEGAQALLERPALRVLGHTVLQLPWAVPWDTAWNRWLPRLEAGSSRRFGPFVRSSWPLWPEGALDARLLVDYLGERGPAGGLAAAWRGPPGDAEAYRGELLAWGVRDRGEDLGGLEPPRRERGRLELFHRDELPFGLRRELELSWLSDERVLAEYFEREAKTDKEPESAAFLRWRYRNQAATLLARYRLNDFQTQTEHLPRLRFDWVAQPLLPWRPAPYLSLRYELTRVRQRYAAGLLVPARLGERLWRADLDHRLEWPLALGPLVATPSFTARASGFSEVLDPEGGEQGRLALGAGALLSTDVWRDFELGSLGYPDLALRHLVTPLVGYTDTFHVDDRPEIFIPIDEVEQVRELAAVVLGLRNRVLLLEGERRRELLDLRLATRYFPDPRQAGGQHWDVLRGRLMLRPLAGAELGVRASWDLERGRGLRADLEARLQAGDLALHASYHALRDRYEAVGGGLAAVLSPRWAVEVSTQYDFVRDAFVSNRLVLQRRLHRFVLELAVEADFGENDLRVAVDFQPVELLEGGVLERTRWREPLLY
ncbi:MAG: hypothetical protein KatS3mg102_2170 [Planctomycetota bacterium]|nr:MAG: hypothetical protein KatS3mg102_2170 [Planctomycetota bacterium]